MKFTLGLLSGLAAAWAGLAIWRRLPEIGPIDAVDDDWGPRRGDRCPGFGGSVYGDEPWEDGMWR